MRRAQKVIHQLLVENGFKAAVLTNSWGLPLVALPYGMESEAPAAMVALIRRTFKRVHDKVGLREMEEVRLRDEMGQSLVCRRIITDEHDLVLAVLVPPGQDNPAAIDRAVQQIEEEWLS
jgi:predicted regulator of Ras-like GTPase activity (Roadblock/LC7/MglB family)